MKNHPLYALLFTIGLCCLCAGALTCANSAWTERIQLNKDYRRGCAIVSALGLWDGTPSREEIGTLFGTAIKEKKRGEMTYYVGVRGGRKTGYALDVQARGKYGAIKGIVAITTDRRHIRSLRIYEQQETPGLGGRIGSAAFLGQFDNLPMIEGDQANVVITNKKTVKGPNIVQGITGASKTTFAFGRSLNIVLNTFLSGGVKLVPVDFGTSEDAVTRATPGYPKNQVKPPHLREEVRRAPFLAPPGIVNLALDKPVTSSIEDEPIIGEYSQITDGVKKSGDFDYVELDPGPQHVQIDLGATHTIFCVVVWHYYKNPIIYKDVIIQASNDPEFETGVVTLFNNDDDESSELGAGKDTAYFARWWGEVADARGPDREGTPCRYIRVYTNGGYNDEETRFVEIAVYGK